MSNGSTESVGKSKVINDTAKLDRELTDEEKQAIQEQVQEAVEQVSDVVMQQQAPPGTPALKRKK